MLASHRSLQSLPGRPTCTPGRSGPGLIGTGNEVVSEVAAVITPAPLIFRACLCSIHPGQDSAWTRASPRALPPHPTSRSSTSGPEVRFPRWVVTE